MLIGRTIFIVVLLLLPSLAFAAGQDSDSALIAMRVVERTLAVVIALGLLVLGFILLRADIRRRGAGGQSAVLKLASIGEFNVTGLNAGLFCVVLACCLAALLSMNTVCFGDDCKQKIFFDRGVSPESQQKEIDFLTSVNSVLSKCSNSPNDLVSCNHVKSYRDWLINSKYQREMDQFKIVSEKKRSGIALSTSDMVFYAKFEKVF